MTSPEASSARDELRKYVSLLADGWTPFEKTTERVERLYTKVRAEVLDEDGLLPKADVVAWLDKKARENTPISQLASKVFRGAIRPNNVWMLPADPGGDGGEPTDPMSAIRTAIRDFDFAFYGLDDIDPRSEASEWVGDLAAAISAAIGNKDGA